MGDLIHLTGNPSNRRPEHVLNDIEKRAYFVSSCMGNLYGRLGMAIVSSNVHTSKKTVLIMQEGLITITYLHMKP